MNRYEIVKRFAEAIKLFEERRIIFDSPETAYFYLRLSEGDVGLVIWLTEIGLYIYPVTKEEKEVLSLRPKEDYYYLLYSPEFKTYEGSPMTRKDYEAIIAEAKRLYKEKYGVEPQP